VSEPSRDAGSGRLLTAEPSKPDLEEEQEAVRPEPEREPVAAVEPRRPRRLDIVGKRNWYFAVSLLIIVPGILSIIFRGFLLGIDFKGGTELTLKFVNQPALQQVQAVVSAETDGLVQPGANGTFIVRTTLPADPHASAKLVTDIESKVGPLANGGQPLSQDTVGPSVAREIVTGALLAVVAASAAILLYLAFRFRRVQGGWRSGFQFGGSALLALLHDVAVVTGIFSILGGVFGLRIGQIDALFVTAILTVVGFSVHDTIVVFDRIRENLIVSSRLTFDQVVNLSIMQTAVRSMITSFTVVLVLIALLLFGGDTLRGFVLALLIGIVSGAYSSIFNASQLLVVWRRLQPVR
jgi:preprotein translocase subunit SecF